VKSTGNMNEPENCTGDEDHDRGIGIDLYFGDKAFLSPNLNEDSNIGWKNRTPDDCPNQGWVEYN